MFELMSLIFRRPRFKPTEREVEFQTKHYGKLDKLTSYKAMTIFVFAALAPITLPGLGANMVDVLGLREIHGMWIGIAAIWAAIAFLVMMWLGIIAGFFGAMILQVASALFWLLANFETVDFTDMGLITAVFIETAFLSLWTKALFVEFARRKDAKHLSTMVPDAGRDISEILWPGRNNSFYKELERIAGELKAVKNELLAVNEIPRGKPRGITS